MRKILFIISLVVCSVCYAQQYAIEHAEFKIKQMEMMLNKYTIEVPTVVSAVKYDYIPNNLTIVDTENENISIFENKCKIEITKDSIFVDNKYRYGLNDFKNDMMFVENKYKEWCKIVKKEKIDNFVKPIINNGNYCILFSNISNQNILSLFFGDYTNVSNFSSIVIKEHVILFNKIVNCIFNFDEIIQIQKDKIAEAIEKSREKEYKLSLLK